MTNINQILSKIQQECIILVENLKSENDGLEAYFKRNETQISIIDEIKEPTDLILVNNSFIYREGLKANKSEKYIAFLNLPPQNEEDIVISSGLATNGNWKFISKNSNNYPDILPLREAVQEALSDLGTIVYVLIGQVGTTMKVVEGSVNSGIYNHLILNNQIDDVQIDGKTIIINPELSNFQIEELLEERISIDASKQESFWKSFHESLNKLRKDVFSPLEIPSPTSDVEHTFLDILLGALESEINSYSTSLNLWSQNQKDIANFNNLLRIAYNFTGDILKLIRLIINISDLKPLLLWMTINSQYELYRAFKSLDWQHTNKPSLNEYDILIKSVRNAKFHNFLDIKNTLDVNLEGIMLQAKRMTFFGEYQRGGTQNTFEYEDQQLVEVLKEFNRANENEVSDSFWNQNLNIMNATYNLVSDICNSLKLLRLLEE